jgi:uncharacterized protein (TIGR03083 family)
MTGTVTDFSWLGDPIDVRDLFLVERTELLADLRGLEPADWARAAVPGWTVKDVAAHLLGDDYGRLARMRDEYPEGPRPNAGEAFPAFIHRANQEWVKACARLSPRSLIDTLDLTGHQIAQMWRHSDLTAHGTPVSWAGADPAPLWLDCARDFTEYWVHRQQIREATGRPPIADPRFLCPVLDTFMRALPFTMRGTEAAPGTQVEVTVSGRAGATWTVTAVAGGWSLTHGPARSPTTTVRLDPDTAWRLCTRGVEPKVALERVHLGGDRTLAVAACQVLSIIR